MLTEVTQTTFTVKVGGRVVGTFPTRPLAESCIIHLSPDEQPLAEIIPTDQGSGKQLLFG